MESKKGHSIHPSGSTEHLPRLDSLRGLAALMVAGSHALTPGSTEVGRKIIAAFTYFFDGRNGVVIFFVLSGMVLGNSLRRGGNLSTEGYVHFYVRRMFRLYPAYFISTLFYLGLYLVLSRHFGTGHGFFDYYRVPGQFSFLQLIGNFCFLNQGLNIVTWTLKVEVIAAVFLPFMHYWSRRSGWWGQALLAMGLLGLAFIPASHPTRMCLYLFYAGYLLSPLLRRTDDTAVSQARIWPWALLLVALVAFGEAHLFSGTNMGRRLGMLAAAIGTMALLILLLRNPDLPPFRILDHPWIWHLGVISYSFYLFNLFLLDLTQRLMPYDGAMPNVMHSFAYFLVAAALCVGIATLSYRLIERPSVKLGARLYQRALQWVNAPKISTS